MSLLHYGYITVAAPLVDSSGSGDSKSEKVSSYEEQSVLWTIARVSSAICRCNNTGLEVVCFVWSANYLH